MKVFETLTVFIIILISTKFGSFDGYEFKYTVTVQPACKCRNVHNEEVFVRLLKKQSGNIRVPLGNNFQNCDMNCNKTYEFKINGTEVNDLEDIYVEFNHVGCYSPLSEMPVKGEKGCNIVNDDVFQLMCKESYPS